MRPKGLFKNLKIMNKALQYIQESKSELKKVVWPTKKETMNYTILVIGISLGVAAFFGILDYFLSFGLEQLLLNK
jgi:preprotein translocase subunit SecE